MLQELEIKVYPNSEVNSYKHHAYAKIVQRLRWQLLATLGLTALLGVLYLGLRVIGTTETIAETAWVFPVFSAVAVMFCGIRWREGAFWATSDDLTRYQEKARLPAAVTAIISRIEQHALTTRFRIESIKTDPLLFVSHGDISVCVAIWEKPGRKQPLIGQ